MRSSRPAAGAGISTSILSVVTSQMGSSASTQSPGRFRHSTMVPSATETPICGITTSTAFPVACSVGEELTAGLLHVFELGQHGLLERWAEWDRDIGRGEAPDRRVEVLERLLGDDRRHLGTDTGGPGCLVRHENLARLAGAGENRVSVQ